MKKMFKKNQLMITALALMIAVAGYLHFSGDVKDQITISDEQAAAQADETQTTEAANLMEYDVEDTFTAEELASMDDGQLGQLEEQNEQIDMSDLDIISLDEDAMLWEDEEYEDELAEVSSEDVSLETAQSSDVEDGEIPGEAVFTSTLNVNTLQGAKLLKEQTRATNKETLLGIINSTSITQEQKQVAIDSMINMTTIAEKEMSAEILLDAKGFDNAVVSMTGDTADVVVSAQELSDAQRAQIEDIVVRKTGVPIENIVISTTVN